MHCAVSFTRSSDDSESGSPRRSIWRSAAWIMMGGGAPRASLSSLIRRSRLRTFDQFYIYKLE